VTAIWSTVKHQGDASTLLMSHNQTGAVQTHKQFRHGELRYWPSTRVETKHDDNEVHRRPDLARSRAPACSVRTCAAKSRTQGCEIDGATRQDACSGKVTDSRKPLASRSRDPSRGVLRQGHDLQQPLLVRFVGTLDTEQHKHTHLALQFAAAVVSQFSRYKKTCSREISCFVGSTRKCSRVQKFRIPNQRSLAILTDTVKVYTTLFTTSPSSINLCQ
jgi:hypothetical protein